MSTRSPVERSVKASRAAWRNCRSSPRSEPRPDPVHGSPEQRQADRLEVHPDLVRPSRLEPDTQQRALATRRSTSKRVTASRGVAVSSGCGWGRDGRGEIGASMQPLLREHQVTLDERHVLALELAPADEALHCTASYASAEHVTTSSPDVWRGRAGG